MFQNALMNLSDLYCVTILLRAWREFASIACIIICGCCFDMVLGKIWLIISSTTMMNMNLNMTTLVYIYLRSLFYWKNIFHFGNSISHYKLPFPLSLAFMCWCFQVMISGKKWDMNYWLCICQRITACYYFLSLNEDSVELWILSCDTFVKKDRCFEAKSDTASELNVVKLCGWVGSLIV